MGSAAAYQLAQRGVRVIGIDQHAPPHTLGSTHGDTRVTREATAEGAEYVPLAQRSHQLWREIEAESGADLFTACGVLMIGPAAPGGSMHGVDDWVASTAALAARFEIEHEVLSGAAARERYPLFAIDDDARAYFEPGGGFVRPEAAVAAQLQLAERLGAELRLNERVLGLNPLEGGGVEVTTTTGALAADHVVLCAGAWVPTFVNDPALRARFTIHRQTLHWFAVDPARARIATPEHCPVYMWTFGTAPEEHFYGFPAIDGAGGGMKVANEVAGAGAGTDLARASREVPTSEARAMYDACLRGRHVGVTATRLRSATCLYTSTPGSRFIIDTHPELADVTLVSPCSGHGFKHSVAIGESIAQRIADGRSEIDLSWFGV